MQTKEKISIILPTFNEGENIPCLIEDIHNALSGCDHEILVIDDNSADGTYEAARSLKAPYVKAILRTTDASLGKSIRCGIENASGDIFVIMDSDYNHQPRYIPFMLQSLSHYDCVLASRFLYGGRMDHPVRHYCSWIFNIFTRLMTGGGITDSLYGYFAIKRKTMEECPYDLIFWGYGDYCIRLVYYLQKKNVPVLQIPAVNGKRRSGQGNSNLVKTFFQYLFEVCKLTYKRFFDKRY